MELVNEKVTHGQFGEGTIEAFDQNVVTIQFGEEKKKFMYPDGFVKFLTLHNKKTAKLVADLVQVNLDEQKAHLLEKEKTALKERKKFTQQAEYTRIMNSHRLHKESQIVFSCDEDELQNVFDHKSIFAGVVKNGVSKGTPIKLIRAYQNSAVLLTSKVEDSAEEERLIYGIFMVAAGFVGKLSEDGNIPADENYYIQISEEEAKQLPFWKYYLNKKSPNKITWNTGKSRYFDNEWMARILVDLYSIKQDVQDKILVRQFLHHFCKMNNILIEDLKQPVGMLNA